jgi:hypothetical protein
VAALGHGRELKVWVVRLTVLVADLGDAEDGKRERRPRVGRFFGGLPEGWMRGRAPPMGNGPRGS